MTSWIPERDPSIETRTFEMIDDNSENFVVGRITRAENEIKPELWNLGIGCILDTGNGRGFMRSR